MADVQADLTFIRPSKVKPVFESAAYTGGAPRVFFDTEVHRVTVHDLREIASPTTIDGEGFEFLHHPSRVKGFDDDDIVTRDYHAETEALLRSRFGARSVAIFDATRRSDAESGAHNPDGTRTPARRVHVDYTVHSGPQRVRDVLGAVEAKRLQRAGARIVQINVWRPLGDPVQRSPLAVADAASVRFEHLVATDQVFPQRVGEIYHLVHDPKQRWFYASRMRQDEVFLIKSWDSRDDGRARFTPHGAFTLPNTPTDAPPRSSIEMRTLVVIE